MSSVLPWSVVPRQYPPDGVEFELAINQSFTGLEMVHRFGYNPEGWEFNGEEIVVPQRKFFKLVPIGFRGDFSAFEAENRKQGVIPDGQWCDAFKEQFPECDGKGPVGVAKASWTYRGNGPSFPCVWIHGRKDFFLARSDFRLDWRCLIETRA